MRNVVVRIFIFACMLFAVGAQAQSTWPNKPVSLVVGYNAGSNPDLVARHIARALQEVWGQPVVVSNRPGSTGMVGAAAVARETPDGSTLFLTSAAALTIMPFLHTSLPYDPLGGFTPIAMVSRSSVVLVASPSAGFKTLNEFIAAAKSHPDQIDYGTFGLGSLHHLSMVRFQRATGIKLNHIPYGSVGPVQDLLAGRIPVMWSSLQIAPLIESGKLTALAFSGLKRTERLPNVPTVSELGYSGFETFTWYGVVAPAGLSGELVKKIEADLAAMVATASYRENLAAIGNEAVFRGAEELKGIIKSEYAENEVLLKDIEKK